MISPAIVEEAFRLLYPRRQFKYIPKLIYSGRFSDYNANVRLAGDILEFRLCKKWRDVSKEIQMGLMQELLLKLFGGKKDSMYIDLYNNFVRNIHIAVPKTKTNPILEESFNRVNDRYFLGIVESPNLEWGTFSKTKLGTYNYKNDTITISKVFLRMEQKFLDYVMYHELLHKVVKYKNNKGRNLFHSSKFRQLERAFDDQKNMEKELTKALRYVRVKEFFGLR